jgi:transcriptional regulator with XRE-family HTH domain
VEIGRAAAGETDFAELLRRLEERLKARIRNGELTERGLALRVGLSQPHTHNVLKGARILTPGTADRILRALRISVLDLLEPEELKRARNRRGERGLPLREAPPEGHRGKGESPIRKPSARP